MTAQQDNPVSVSLLIFSGRPDPTWSLSIEEARQIAEYVNHIRQGEKYRTAPVGGLGYRGFTVLCRDESLELPDELTVFQKVVSIQAGGDVTHWHDTVDLEKKLIADARERGFGDDLDWAMGNLTPPKDDPDSSTTKA